MTVVPDRARARRVLWLNYAGGVAFAAALLVLGRPAQPSGWPWPPAVLAGAATGVCLFVAIERRVPASPRPAHLGVRVWLAKHAAMALWAGVEEVVWRWFVLGELAGVLGPAAALVVTSLAFGVVHRSPGPVHVVCGAVFGGVYLVTGNLLAAWLAHAAYNASVAFAAERRRAEGAT